MFWLSLRSQSSDFPYAYKRKSSALSYQSTNTFTITIFEAIVHKMSMHFLHVSQNSWLFSFHAIQKEMMNRMFFYESECWVCERVCEFVSVCECVHLSGPWQRDQQMPGSRDSNWIKQVWSPHPLTCTKRFTLTHMPIYSPSAFIRK